MSTYFENAVPARGAGWLGHFAPQLLIGAIIASVALVFFPPSIYGPWAAMLPALLVGVVLGSWVALRRHDRSLCEHCAAGMPINPAREAELRRRRLFITHLGSNRRLVMGYLLLLLGASVMLALDPTPTHLMRWPWAAAQSSMIYLVLSHVSHRRLQPWCPWCRDGGGGSGDHAPEPAPRDFSSR